MNCVYFNLREVEVLGKVDMLKGVEHPDDCQPGCGRNEGIPTWSPESCAPTCWRPSIATRYQL